MDKKRLIREFEQLLGPRSVLHEDQHLALYEYDGSIERGRPDLVVFPTTTAHVSAIVKIANREKIPFHARGAASWLCRPRRGGVDLARAAPEGRGARSNVNLGGCLQVRGVEELKEQAGEHSAGHRARPGGDVP